MKFDPVGICRILTEEKVRFVVLGGFAAVVHGSPVPTEDIDVLPSRDRENLERLARALKRLNAAIRTSDGPVRTKLDAGFIANMPNMLNLVTDLGDVDLVFSPAGGLVGYEGWSVRAEFAELEPGVVISVAALDDIIESKTAANRLKDQKALPYLESLRDELRRQSEQ
ncbi:MAG: hypothetical protein FGM45_04400 [Actinobacteria bacterium]|nr:hypothetical protein [Actinomycetota bacterium]